MARAVVPKFPVDSVILALEPGADVPPRSIGYSKLTCPFHDDSIASASIDWDKESFKCFTCGVRGDAIDLVMAVQEVSFGAAQSYCQEAAGNSREDVPQRTARKRGRGLF